MLPFKGDALTAKQLGERWGLAYRTILFYHANKPHLLPPVYKMGEVGSGKLYFSLAEVESYELEHMAKPTADIIP
jgi:hypothetical protein